MWGEKRTTVNTPQQKEEKMDNNNFISSELSRFQSLEFKSSPSKAIDQNKVNIEKIESTKNKLDDLIEDLNTKLFSHFHQKEQDLLDEYKQELIAAQKELNDLKNTTNEEQIRNKMLQRKKELQKERHQLIQTNMFFSNKCEEYKKKLAELVNQGKQLERQIVFLDGQTEQATKKKYEIISQIDPNKYQRESPINTEKDEQNLGIFTGKKNLKDEGHTFRTENKKSISTYDKAKAISNLEQSLTAKNDLKRNLIHSIGASNQKKNIIKNFDWKYENNDHQIGIGNSANQQSSTKKESNIFEKTPLEVLFEKTVEEVKDKRKTKKAMPPLRGEQFTDFQKKMIMELFLSQDEVKKKIYEIIFENADDQHKQYGQMTVMKPEKAMKVKIAYEDIT